MTHPENNDEFPLRPYAGSSGWSGSDASRERAESEDASGITQRRQQITYTLVDDAGPTGITWKELAAKTGWHHGQATSPLSVLHMRGYVARLTEKRDRCSVYVTLRHINGRETASHRGNRLKVAPAPEMAPGRYQAELTVLTRELTALKADNARGATRLSRALRGVTEVVKVGSRSGHPFGRHSTDSCLMCLCHSILREEKLLP